jgi:CheY-like chemotaxis protein
MEEPPRGCETILVVEDDEFVLKVATSLIESLGYRVLSARNGVDALEMLRQSTPIDLLFTDFLMPGRMDGAQLVAEARRLRPELKFLYTSGYLNYPISPQNCSTLHDTLDAGIEQLGKPYGKYDLAVKLRNALDGRRTESHHSVG